MKNTHDTDMIWKNFANNPQWLMCSAKRYHQAMRRIFAGFVR